jgi:hypothetical protein
MHLSVLPWALLVQPGSTQRFDFRGISVHYNIDKVLIQF